MPLWGNDVKKMKEAFEQISQTIEEIEDAEDTTLLPRLELETIELILKLDKTYQKTFDELLEEVEMMSVEFTLSIAEFISHEKFETGISLTKAAAGMLIAKNKPYDAVEVLRSAGEDLVLKSTFRLALEVFAEAGSISDRALELCKEAEDVESSVFWATINYDLYTWGLGCQLCIDQSASKDNVQPLIKLLETGERDARVAAAKMLGKFEAQEAVASLVKGLQDKESPVRIEAIKALQGIGDESVVPDLVKCLSDEDHMVRYHTVKALEDMGDKEAIEPLRKLREKEDKDMQETIHEALKSILERTKEND